MPAITRSRPKAYKLHLARGMSTSMASPATESARKELILASTLTLVGLAAVLIRGGIGAMIAGSVGTIGASVAGITLALADSRLSYTQKASVGLGIVAINLAAALALGENIFAFTGYPLLAIGLAGVIPHLRRRSSGARHAPRRRPIDDTLELVAR